MVLYAPQVEVAPFAIVPVVILTGVPVAPLKVLDAVNVSVFPVEVLAVYVCVPEVAFAVDMSTVYRHGGETANAGAALAAMMVGVAHATPLAMDRREICGSDCVFMLSPESTIWGTSVTRLLKYHR